MRKSLFISIFSIILLSTSIGMSGATTTPRDTIKIRTAAQIIEETVVGKDLPKIKRVVAPWVFMKYQKLPTVRGPQVPDFEKEYPRIIAKLIRDSIKQDSVSVKKNDSIVERQKLLNELWGVEQGVSPANPLNVRDSIFIDMNTPYKSVWLSNAIRGLEMQDQFVYRNMVEFPDKIEYAYWNLPVPPQLAEDDHSFDGYLRRNSIGNLNFKDTRFTQFDGDRINWLHVVNSALQFSQAYVSGNWYQGGNNYLSMLFNFMWDVQLNSVWHKNLLFQSTLSYKLGFNSTADDEYHKYSISQDVFQHNLKIGYKARRNWYYSLTGQFKTQLLNNYKKGSNTLIASFLTPGDLNVGLGMTFNKQSKNKNAQFNASLAPLSYNLKTAINPEINHEQWGIEPDRNTVHAFGSNADMTLNWKIFPNTTYMTRLFLFTDYKYGYGNWEHTFNFQFNKFFSTQLYCNMRYDSSAIPTIAPNWKKLMMKEILSVGLSYVYSTK